MHDVHQRAAEDKEEYPAQILRLGVPSQLHKTSLQRPKRVEMSSSNRIDDHDSRVRFTPKEAWMAGGLTTEFMGTTMGTTTAGALMSFNFTGTGVDVYGSPSLYLASPPVLNLFTIDGGPPAQWSQDPQTWSGPSENVKMFSAQGLQYGPHELVMEVTAQGSGTWIDYLDVAGANDSSQITTIETSSEVTSSSRFSETPSSTHLQSISIRLPPGAFTASFATGASRITTTSTKHSTSTPSSKLPSTTSGGLHAPSILTISITSEATRQASAGVVKHSSSPGATATIAVGVTSGLALMLLLIVWVLRRRWQRLKGRSGKTDSEVDQFNQMNAFLHNRWLDAKLVSKSPIERPHSTFPVIYKLLGDTDEAYAAVTILGR
ncbi:hypothetical protein PM082_023063 [Marasmius tenuissimus]|nr:hypothetical protein PM082_023063 [Marasmius tenuissimus]